ncbi:MAG: hypothetical protein H6858_07695 [Rhodospirillales bacterium]|nr:hypothetical protein [Alphaproteobacteria bacterium]MCB9977464.1 hypothetical protein [Rhodospirillales bacterium]
MGQGGAPGLTTERPTTYEIPNYSNYGHRLALGDDGHHRVEAPPHRRFEYCNINVTDRHLSNYQGDISLVNIVTAARVRPPPEQPPEPVVETRGGLYFAHGYDAYTPKDIVTASGYENVDLDHVADALVHNQTFELKMTAHADTSGDTAKNQTLSENRLQTAEALLIAALQRQGLTEVQARALYDQRVAPHSTIIAEGETNGPVQTEDGTRHQGNRVVTFDLITQPVPPVRPEDIISKGSDLDNHEHIVVVNMGTARRQSEMHFFPEEGTRHNPGQFNIADEDVQFVLRIDPHRNLNEAHQFTVNFWAKTNQVADNTTFLIESDQPGSVTSAYNFETGKIDISLNGQVAASIYIRDHIDPALIRVGQVTSDGHVTVSPLTNLEDVAPLSEARRTPRDSNPVTVAADRIVQLSVEAKHLYIAHPNDQAGYLAALEENHFSERLDEALQDLTERGISTEPLKRLLINQYSNPESALYHPDQLVFPFQTIQGLYESEVSARHIEFHEGQDAYQALTERLTRIASAEATGSSATMEPSTPLQPPKRN